MAQSKATKKLFNMAYGLGASIVIMGALFKILHWDLGFVTGGQLLAVGLITEAIIFAISAFEPLDNDLDWSLVYPELAGGKDEVKEVREVNRILSRKLDDLLKEANIDADLMSSLGKSIRDFESAFKSAAKGIAPSEVALKSTEKYSKGMLVAAEQMESLNNLYEEQLGSIGKQASVNEKVAQDARVLLDSLYKEQLKSVSKQTSVNKEVVQSADTLKNEMKSLATNLSSLNNVYGGMLSAMSKN